MSQYSGTLVLSHVPMTVPKGQHRIGYGGGMMHGESIRDTAFRSGNIGQQKH
ncbi:MAG: hypothetical protein HQ553_10205 [Chloroflexi bacterium]|nr:hypothetical protein [Chloroflexota bacterium]